MVKYKVGDLVRVVKKGLFHEFEIGEIVRVTLVNELSGGIDKCHKLDGSDYWWMSDWLVEPADELDKPMCELAPANTSNPKGCEFCE